MKGVLGAVVSLLSLGSAAFAKPTQSETHASTSAQSPQSDADIVVEGRRAEALREFVEALTDRKRDRQLPRWKYRLCPSIVGIEAPQAQFMKARIEEVAKTVGLIPGEGGCTTPLLVLFDQDPDAVALDLQRALSRVLSRDGKSRVSQFVDSDRPVRWVTVVDKCGFGACTMTNSRLTRSEGASLEAILMVVDGRQIDTVSLQELSDYIAFVGLANPPMGGEELEGSILSLFHSAATSSAPRTLSGSDLSFLKALYQTRPNGSGQEQRQAILRELGSEREKE